MAKFNVMAVYSCSGEALDIEAPNPVVATEIYDEQRNQSEGTPQLCHYCAKHFYLEDEPIKYVVTHEDGSEQVIINE